MGKKQTNKNKNSMQGLGIQDFAYFTAGVQDFLGKGELDSGL